MRETLTRTWLNLGMAFRALFDHPVRSFLTLLGIVIGIVALVVMISLIDALDASVRKATMPLGTGVFQVQREPRFNGRFRDRSQANRKPLKMEDVRTLRKRLDLTREVGGEMWSWGNAFRTAEKKTAPACSIAGATPSFLEANGLELDAGRFLSEEDLLLHRNVAIVGSDVVDTLFPSGTVEALGNTVRLRGKEFTIIGTVKKQPALFGAAWRNCLAIIPVDTFHREFFFRSLHVTFVVKNPDQIEEAMEEAVFVLRSMRNVKPGEPNDFEIFNNASVGESLGSLSLIIGGAAGAISLLALLVGGIGVMNIMLVSVMERTREIGVRKALGARPSTILGQFIAEAVALSGFGGAIGIVLASITVVGAGQLLELPTKISSFAVILALASSALTGLVAGIYPAARAARLDPIEALRHE
ncbi:ABC transporter permease [Myxococcota bacterium]|nr:ABC transporter permease [Myxococcota bacterium]